MTDHTENMFTLEEGLPFHAGARNNSNNHKKMFHSKYSDIIQTISGGVRPSRVGGRWTAVVLRCVASCVRSRH